MITSKVKRMRYAPEAMERAAAAVKNDKISIRKAARIHNVPRTTLIDILKRKQPVKAGKNPFLSKDEESELVMYGTIFIVNILDYFCFENVAIIFFVSPSVAFFVPTKVEL